MTCHGKNSQSEMRVASLLYFCNKIGSTAEPPRNTNPGNSLLLCSEKTKTERKRERSFGRVLVVSAWTMFFISFGNWMRILKSMKIFTAVLSPVAL